MALSMHTAALSFAGNVAPLAQRTGAISMETIEDLKAVRTPPAVPLLCCLLLCLLCACCLRSSLSPRT